MFPMKATSRWIARIALAGLMAALSACGGGGGGGNATPPPPAVSPSITAQPQAKTVVAGQPASFSVTASGTAPLSYQWRKDGNAIAAATSSSFSITSAQVTDAGAYSVVVSNSSGTATSADATLAVNAPPTIGTQPIAAQSIPAGGTATFSVAATGNGTLSYQWTKGGVNLTNGGSVSGATNPTLTLTGVQAADAGSFACVVTNTLGGTTTSTTSATGTLTVTALPVATLFSLVGFPTPTTAGAANTFTVTALDASGNTAPSYVGTVHFSSSDANATLPANYTFVAGDNGVHTFTATLTTAGTQTLTVTDVVSASITGSQPSISVTPTVAARLIVSGFPSSTTSGVSHPFTVTAQDAYGNTAVGYAGTVHFASSDVAAILPANYTFTAGDNGAHTFSATLATAGAQNLSATDTASASITGNQSSISVIPAAAVRLNVSGFPNPTVAGVAHSFTVTAQDSAGNVATGYAGTVHFASTDGTASLPVDYIFVAGDGGVHVFSCTLSRAGSQTLTATDTVTSSITGSQASITVNPSAPTHFSLSGYPTSTVAGTASSFTVTALDSSNNTVTGYTGSVSFSSSDSAAILPANYTFASGDNGSHTFQATFKTAGSQSITVTDTATSSITGNQSSISVTAAGAAHLVLSGFPSPTQPGVSHAFTVSVQDAFNNLTSGYGGTVHFTSSDGSAVLPADYTFTSADSGTHTFNATLNTTGTQTLTATDVVNSALTGSQTSISVGAAAPTILTQPQTQTVLPPDPVTFSVSAKANGGGTLTYQWKKNGADIPGATGSSFTVPSTEFATNTDAYTVTVAEGSLTTDSSTVYALASVPSPTYAGDPVAVPSRPLTVLPSLHVDAVNFPNGAFRLGYDESLKDPVWSAYVNFPVKLPYANSTADYTADLRLAAPQVGKNDYTGLYTGGANYPDSYDRGHMTPRADVSYRYTPVAGDDATIMSNLVPQISQLNQQTWQKLEDAIGGTSGGTTNGLTSFKGRVWVYTGSVFSASPTWWNSTVTPGLKVAIPEGCYKIVVHETSPGHPEVLAVLMPNVWGLTNSTSTLTWYVTSVARIEALTGLDFFPNLASVAPTLDIPTWKATVDVRGWQAPFEQTTGPNVHMVEPSYDTTVEVGSTVNFNGAATPNSGAAPGTTISGATWNFGDSSPTSSGFTTSHTFNAGGSFSVTFTALDSLGSSNVITRVVRVIPPASSNTAPTTTPTVIPDQTTTVGQAVTVNFTVADDRTLPGSVVVAASSDNTTLLPVSGIVVTNASGSVSLILTPAAGQSGTATVTVTLTDGDGAVTTKTFLLTVNAAATNVLTEGFESGTKTAYATAPVTFTSGTWTLNDALVGTSASDRKTGLQSIRVRNGIVTMGFDWAAGAQTVTVNHAKYGTDADSSWELWYSTDSGATWTVAGPSVTSNMTTLTQATFTLNIPGPIRFEFRKLGGTTTRFNLDDFQINGY